MQRLKIASMFSLVSVIKGRIGVSHTTVGIPASFKVSSAAKRSLVGAAFGSMILHTVSSQAVIVICTTHFAFTKCIASV